LPLSDADTAMTDASGPFTVEIADYEADLADLRAVREPVFVIEQQVPPDLEWDDLDPRSHHVIARDGAGQPIGTGRLTPEHKIGRMAVLPAWRGRGVGEAILTRLIDLAHDLGYVELKLHAQVSAIDFYRRAGFEAYGPRFMEAGIEHQSMRLALAPREAAAATPAPGLEDAPRLPADLITQRAEREFDGVDPCRDAFLEVLQGARYKLWIYSRDLDPGLLAGSEMLDEIRRIGLSGRGAEVRILLQDPLAARRSRSPLVALAQRMSSTVQVRQVIEEVDLQYASAFVLNDNAGYLFRPLASRFEGCVSTHGPGRHRQLLDYFRQVWDRAVEADELRPMRL
jgi:predicted GNAT family N-acyltransferase